jgi:starch synthase
LHKVKTIFTIHNGVYQGWCPWKKAAYLPAFNQFNAGLLDWNGIINPMACAMRCANAVTTVSWSYMYELMEKANGLEGLFQSLRHKCHGVLNGIDNDIWNPADDAYLAHHYTAESVLDGKAKHKQEICELFQLNPANPLIVFIGRLVGEKGADLLPDAIGRALYETKGQVNYLVLGSGDEAVESSLNHLKFLCPNIYNCFIGYNEALSHRLYAAADFIVMPSRVEPCGLNQMYALRYGTIPMVRNTGGLRDTVVDFGDWEGFGIRFNNASVDDVVLSTHRALNLYRDKARFEHIQQRIMGFDNSWERSTAQYEKIYG